METTNKLDSLIGLDYIVENSDYVLKLAAALDSNNENVKKKVFELLSALCAYSRSGYNRAIETFENYKNLKNERYRFKVVVTELEKTVSLDYKVAILAFLNCLIISAKTCQARIRMRNEFIGLRILPVLNELRRSGGAPSLREQLEVFFEQKECDDSQTTSGPEGIHLNSHLDVFYAILRQVADTPQEAPFLNILQHLLKIDAKDPISDVIWDTAEKLIHRATLIEKQDDTIRLLRSPSSSKVACHQCHNRIESINNNRKLSLSQNLATSLSNTSVNQDKNLQHSPNIAANATMAIPPPPPPMSAPAPPPPPAPSINNKVPVPPACPPPPPIVSLNVNHEVSRPKTPNQIDQPMRSLPQQDTPIPRSKMKTINWNKIPQNKIFGKTNIWTIVADNHQDSPMTEINWEEMEGLFCQQANDKTSSNVGKDSVNNVERKTKRDNEIVLLDGKRSLNINIFIKQFRKTNEEITEMIQMGSHDEIGVEKLRGLLKILPEFDEFEMLRTFDGDRERLGNAEKFLMHLLQVPNYKLRIECMLLKEEFSENMSFLEPSINSMLYAGEDLMTNKSLREVLYMIVVVGNFLNAGGYAGSACGIKLSSLQKITEIRANKPGMNLIHFVALQAEKKNKDLLSFPEQFSSLENASKTTIEQLNNEINTLDKRISTIKKQIELPSTEEDIKLQMAEFLKTAEENVSNLLHRTKQLDVVRVQLAEFFCEDPAQFKIEECFKIFYHLCEKFKAACRDNEKRRFLEEQAKLRRKNAIDNENCFLDIRFSPALSRRRIGSFNSNNESFSREDTASPDITPTGSLRRRRSRALPDEDDHNNLMDFLRSSGHDNFGRERKSAAYGSLDRSWARRARSGSAEKKRPNLLSVDFGNDRERAPSPSIIVENNPNNPSPDSEDVKPRISREWRQKIENWLQGNEQDEKYNEDFRKKARRITTNRRSLEADSDEKGSKLDTLPEEKSHNSSPQSADPSKSSPKASEPTSSYRRVYPEWKPSTSLENANVIDTMEAIEGMTYVPTMPARITTSPIRNTSMDVKSDVKETITSPTSHGNSEEINKQSIYIHSPVVEPLQINNSLSPKSNTPHNTSVYIKPSDNPSSILTNKIEIDSDNIETPPTQRKSFQGLYNQTSPKTDNNAKLSNSENLGIGQFDRYSSTRRTRRFKKPLDISNISEDANFSTTSPDSTSGIVSSFPENSLSSKTLFSSPQDSTETNSSITPTSPVKSEKCERIIERIGKIGKNISRISQEDVREAIRSLKSPSPEREWKESFRPPILSTTTKAMTHELNDEGFEETQSLVSDTPSLTTSSCNEEAARSKGIKSSSNNGVSKSSNKEISAKVKSSSRSTLPSTSQINSLVARNQQSLERSRSLRNPSTSSSLASRSLTSTPKRVASMRLKPDLPLSSPSVTAGVNKRLDVERSNSIASLRSSRSSINSAVSTNTVKVMPLKKSVPFSTSSVPTNVKRTAVTTSTIPSSMSSNISNSNNVNRTTARIPASRSSSSGSSVGQNVSKKPPIFSPTKRITPTPVTTSRNPQISSRVRLTQNLSVGTNNNNSQRTSSSSSGSSFMRPTTSSATKVKSK